MWRGLFVIAGGYLTVSCGGLADSAAGSEQGGMSSGGNASSGGGNASFAGQASTGGAGLSESCFGVSAAISSAELSKRVEQKLGLELDPEMIELPGGTPKERAQRLAGAIDSAVQGSILPGPMSRVLRDLVVDRLLAQTDPMTQERRVQPFPTAVSPSLGAELDEEFELAIAHWLSEGSGTLEHLLTDNTAFATSLLARHYGLPAPESEGFVPVLQPRETQMGLLTRGAFLARQSLAPARGTFLLEALTCVPMVPPPAVMVSLWDQPDRPPVKQIVEQSYGHTGCAGCHDVYIGYSIALDRYDELGRYREQQNGVTIDTSSHLLVGGCPPNEGRCVPTTDGRGYIEFAGPEELGRTLSKVPGVHQCLINALVQHLGMAELTEVELRCVMGEFDAKSASLSALLAVLAPRWVGQE
jgi:hypothetical protein